MSCMAAFPWSSLLVPAMSGFVQCTHQCNVQQLGCQVVDSTNSSGVQVDAKLVKELRQSSGAGMMDCKRALAANDNNIEKASEYLRKKGLASADKKAGRVASEGAIGAYIHAGSKCVPCASGPFGCIGPQPTVLRP